MKERPILFSGEMVRAILEGRKTQTRRTKELEFVSSYPGYLSGDSDMGRLGYRGLETSDYYIKDKKDFKKNPGLYHLLLGKNGIELNPIPVKCPYGKVGDRLWVRETHYLPASGYTDVNSEWVGRIIEDARLVKYAASDEPVDTNWKNDPYRHFLTMKRPSIHMPRWASRITLEITNVRVEHLLDISEEDAKAEGVHIESFAKYQRENNVSFSKCHGYAFKCIWESINGPGSWEKNPWVWVIEFKKVKP